MTTAEYLAALRATRAIKLAELECQHPMTEGEKAVYKIGFNDGAIATCADVDKRLEALLNGETP